MSMQEIIRAWKDEHYRKTLSEDELRSLPENPAGQIELDLPDLLQANGGHTFFWFTGGCCTQTQNTCSTACVSCEWYCTI